MLTICANWQVGGRDRLRCTGRLGSVSSAGAENECPQTRAMRRRSCCGEGRGFVGQSSLRERRRFLARDSQRRLPPGSTNRFAVSYWVARVRVQRAVVDPVQIGRRARQRRRGSARSTSPSAAAGVVCSVGRRPSARRPRPASAPRRRRSSGLGGSGFGLAPARRAAAARGRGGVLRAGSLGERHRRRRFGVDRLDDARRRRRHVERRQLGRRLRLRVRAAATASEQQPAPGPASADSASCRIVT